MCEYSYKETDWTALKRAIAHTAERTEAIVQIKDAIIGSNRQKSALLAHDIVPDILRICTGTDGHLHDKMNAMIILGSLAKGSKDIVQILITKYNVISLLINEITFHNVNSKYVEICLGAMKSLYDHPNIPIDDYFTDTSALAYFLSLASTENSLKTQICVTSILFSLCQTYNDQIRLLKAGTLNVLARMITSKTEEIQIPALRCLAYMCYKNRSVADNICVTSHQGNSLPDILNTLLCRLYHPEIQLTAAKCLTYIYICGTLPSTDPRIVDRALPTLSRLCSDAYTIPVREAAAETMAYLTELDSDLQCTAAISNSLFRSLAQLLQGEESSTRQAALRCFASLGANEESIRKRIVDVNGLMQSVLENLGDPNTQVKMASIRCLHSLSRSVQQLRTSFQDHVVWKQIMQILVSDPSLEFLIVVSSIVCNLLLEFSPSKEPLLNSGIIEKLCLYLDHTDTSLRLNSIWALMNMSFQADEDVKTNIITALGTQRILELLKDNDETIVMKTLGLLRNLLSKPYHIDFILNVHSTQVLAAVNVILDSDHSVDVKEQVLCIIGNVAASSPNSGLILNDNKTMTNLSEFLLHPDAKLQAGCLYAINNIVQRKDSCSEEKYFRLAELDIIKGVCELHKKNARNKMCEEYINRILKQIVIQCKTFCPEIIY